jgi:hypothetical protein
MSPRVLTTEVGTELGTKGTRLVVDSSQQVVRKVTPVVEGFILAALV